MSAWDDFPKEFLRRTMWNVEKYQGEYEVTNLINWTLATTLTNKSVTRPREGAQT
jgi:hypothetical protein